MAKFDLSNWKTQIKKGYLDLCILSAIEAQGKSYGFDLIEKLKSWDLPVKEGTIYPLLNRMTTEGTLNSQWDTESPKGHPRKFYSLTSLGKDALKQMNSEFLKMVNIHSEISNTGEKNDEQPST